MALFLWIPKSWQCFFDSKRTSSEPPSKNQCVNCGNGGGMPTGARRTLKTFCGASKKLSLPRAVARNPQEGALPKVPMSAAFDDQKIV
jgi:hypothetical protein